MSTTHTTVTLTEEELTRIATALVIYASNNGVTDLRFNSTMSALCKVNAALDVMVPTLPGDCENALS